MSVALLVTRVASTWGARAGKPGGGSFDLVLAAAMTHHRAGKLLLGRVFASLAQGANTFEAEAERRSVHGPVLNRLRLPLSPAGRLSDPTRPPPPFGKKPPLY